MKATIKANIRYQQIGLVAFKVRLGGFFGQCFVYQCNERTVEKVGSIEQLKQLIALVIERTKAEFKDNLEFVKAVQAFIYRGGQYA